MHTFLHNDLISHGDILKKPKISHGDVCDIIRCYHRDHVVMYVISYDEKLVCDITW